MKMIIAIVRDNDTDNISHALILSNFRVTTIASTGGFLRKGKSTLLVGVEDEKLEQALRVIRDAVGPITDPQESRAIIFVVKVDSFDHF